MLCRLAPFFGEENTFLSQQTLVRSLFLDALFPPGDLLLRISFEWAGTTHSRSPIFTASTGRSRRIVLRTTFTFTAVLIAVACSIPYISHRRPHSIPRTSRIFHRVGLCLLSQFLSCPFFRWAKPVTCCRKTAQWLHLRQRLPLTWAVDGQGCHSTW